MGPGDPHPSLLLSPSDTLWQKPCPLKVFLECGSTPLPPLLLCGCDRALALQVRSSNCPPLPPSRPCWGSCARYADFFFFFNVLSYSLCPFLQTKSPHSDKGQADSQSCSSSHHWPSFCLGDKLSGMLTTTFSCLGKMSRDKTRSLIMEGSVNWTQLFEADL